MKISKLTIAALLTMGLVVTGCNSKKSQPSSDTPSSESSSGSQVDPVTRIKVTSLTRALIVGEEINLDDYVSVVGGEGPKVFTAQLVAGENVISLEGKTLTALAEGSFSLKILAGAMDANFAGNVYSQVRADIASVLAETIEGYDAYGLANTGELNGKFNIHRSDYYAATNYYLDSATVTGGMLRAENGNTYEFTMDDKVGTNLDVKPSIVSSDFSHWSTQIDINIDISEFDLVVDEETGNPVGLELSPEKPVFGAGWAGIFENAVDQYAAAILDINLAATIAHYSAAYAPLKLTPVKYQERNAFIVTPQIEMSGMVYSVNRALVVTGESTSEVTAVRSYIDAGNFPEPIPFVEMQNSLKAVADAKNYTYEINAGWFTSTGDPSTVPTDGWMPKYGNYFTVGSEQTKVSDSAKYSQFGTGKISGYIEHESKLYSFQNSKVEEEWGTTLNATEVEGKTTLWGDLVAETLGDFSSLSVWTDFEVSSRTEDGNKVVFEFVGPKAVPEEGEPDPISSLFESTTVAYGVDVIGCGLSIGEEGISLRNYFDYTLTVDPDAGTIEIELQFNWDSSHIYYLDYVISNVGTTVMPDLSGIVYPAA